eukprot:GCRY01004558.1.p1 GENE.GCRY01004558.1~~GCRY01004558.1.p1  ORF type:complete len:269 (-),score=31.33 GCRY01004558.1:492-1298(-)
MSETSSAVLAKRDNNFLKTCHFSWKTVLIGDCKVGKTKLLHSFLKVDPLKEEEDSNSMLNNFEYIFEENEQRFCVHFWDTSGATRFENLLPWYCSDAACIICCFDVSNKRSLNHLEHVLQDVVSAFHSHLKLVLVGCKSDLTYREVSRNSAEQFARKFHMRYIETSAISGSGVSEVFYHAFSAVLSTIPPSTAEPLDLLDTGITIWNQTADSETFRGLLGYNRLSDFDMRHNIENSNHYAGPDLIQGPYYAGGYAPQPNYRYNSRGTI